MPRFRVAYFEYSSTTSDSLIVAGSSERCGFALNVPFMRLGVDFDPFREAALFRRLDCAL